MQNILSLESKYFKFIYNRQLIWYNRFILKQSPPWTKDPVLSKYKIINVYRELDKCTIYILNKLKNIKNREVLLKNIVFYRFFNTMDLYEKLDIRPFEGLDKKLKDKLMLEFNLIKEKGEPIFNNAYLISSGIKGKKKHESIIDYIAQVDFLSLIKKIDNSKTPKESLDVIQGIPMVGPFLACEIWTDLTYFKFFKQKWTDNDFVNIGPGAKWGLEIIYGKKLNKTQLNEKLYHLYTIQKSILPSINQKLNNSLNWADLTYKNAYSNYPFLSITNIEGSLCEFRKYARLKEGKGKKRYYKFNTDNF